jgi:hypothetical protein
LVGVRLPACLRTRLRTCLPARLLVLVCAFLFCCFWPCFC